MALADACWHRLAPLSMGKLVGADEIQCPYHGLRYNPAGRCTRLPAQETLNPSASVPSFPVVERHRYVWVWPGDATLADPSTIPDMHQMDDPGWAGDGLTIEAACNYQLILDNLMDLTHEEFVHGSSLGQDELSQSEFSTRLESDNHVSVTRWMIDVEPPAFWAKNIRDRFPDFSGRVDRWQIIHYYAPSTICIDVGVAPTGTGAPEGDRSQGVNGYVMNTITPETERTSHYFWAFMRNYRLDSQQITTELRNGVRRRVRRGRGDADGAAGSHRRQPRLRVLQPQHRRRRHVGAPDPGPDAAGRGPRTARRGAAVPRDAGLADERGAVTNRAELDWRACRVVETVPVADDVRRITIERPGSAGRARARQPRRRPGPAGWRPSDRLRSYSVVESDDDRPAADDHRAAGRRSPRRLGVHARLAGRRH